MEIVSLGIENVQNPCCVVHSQHGNERDDAWLCLFWQAIREGWSADGERGEGAREGSKEGVGGSEQR